MPIIPRWESRAFGERFGAAEDRLESLSPERVEESDDLYLLSPLSDASVKVRGGQMDIKHLLAVNDDGLEQWKPVMKASFPLSAEQVQLVLESLDVTGVTGPVESLDELIAGLPDVRAANVHKHREHYSIDGCMVEVAAMRVDDAATRTIAIESEDPAIVTATVHELGLEAHPNVCVARGLKALIGFGGRRYAVIDVGTNSVKFHIGERGADGRWRRVVDRAEVTRLGEGLDQSSRFAEAAIGRTVEAVVGMNDEAGRHGVEGLVAVGTAGLRVASNAAEFIDAVRARSGIEVEVISGDEERRLAYIATTAGLPPTEGSIVVFDSGGGSSQFTFAGPEGIAERFSVNVGAVLYTERYGLDGVVSPDTLGAALEALAGDLERVGGRGTPATLVGMGGTATNLAAVKHGLARYDADVVHGTVLDRDEIDRQIEAYRTRTADQRREIVGLQANRAEVILAGACIVRTVLTLLERESLAVSDRGLRHGLLVERFT